MICNFKFICPQIWWMVDVGFSHVLDEDNLTQAQEKCLDLDIQATNIMYRQCSPKRPKWPIRRPVNGKW